MHKQLILCFATEGQKVSVKNSNLTIFDNDGEVILQQSCFKIFALWIIGGVSITSGLLQKSKKFGFSVSLFSYYHRLYGQWNVQTEGNFLLRQKQYSYGQLNIARHLVANKVSNQQALLKGIREKKHDLKETLACFDGYLTSAVAARDVKELLGIEGISSKLFYRNWFTDMHWQSRKPRTKQDPINTLLDIGYTYLFRFTEGLLNLYGFDLYKGVYHTCFYQRKSLVCDIMEPFRCIVDKQVRKAYNLGQFKTEHFVVKHHQYYLLPDYNKQYLSWISKALLQYKEGMFCYVQDYYRSFIRQKALNEYPVFNIS